MTEYEQDRWADALEDPRDHVPATPMEALMVAYGAQDPVTSAAEYMPLREAIGEAIDDLGETDQRIFNALFIEPPPRLENGHLKPGPNTQHVSLRDLEAELGISKSQIARERDRILRQLRDVLAQHPSVTPFLRGTP